MGIDGLEIRRQEKRKAQEERKKNQEDERNKKKYVPGWLVFLTFAGIFFLIIWIISEEPSTLTNSRNATLTREQRIEKMFSHWDGSHRELERKVKEMMNDPDSYKHVETVYQDPGPSHNIINIKTTFRGKNKFGGVVKSWVWAKSDLDGNVLEIISQEEY